MGQSASLVHCILGHTPLRMLHSSLWSTRELDHPAPSSTCSANLIVPAPSVLIKVCPSIPLRRYPCECNSAASPGREAAPASGGCEAASPWSSALECMTMLTTFCEPAGALFKEENHALNSVWFETIGAATAPVAVEGAGAASSPAAGLSVLPAPAVLTTGATLPLCSFTVSWMVCQLTPFMVSGLTTST